MIEIKEFHPRDIEGLSAVAPEIAGGSFLWEPGYAYTILAEGRPIAACGIRTLWQGVGEAWAFITRTFRGRPRAFRRIQDLLEYAEARGSYTRIHCFVPEYFHEGRSFVRHLGFTCEAFLAGFFPNDTGAVVYVRRAPWQQQQL